MTRIIDGKFEVDESNVLIKYHQINGITEVVIPSSIAEIWHFAFQDCKNLISVTIPNSVKYIGFAAFYNCTNLENINIPNSIIKILELAFMKCNNLKNISIPSYREFCLLENDLKQTAILSILKNYYTNKIKYSDEDIENFKKYIIDTTFEDLEKYKKVIKNITCNMGNFFGQEDISQLLSKNTDAEVNAMLLEYINKIRNEKTNPLADLDLGEVKNNLVKRKRKRRKS